MSKLTPKPHLSFYYKELFRLYKLHRFFLVGIGLMLIAGAVTPYLEQNVAHARIKTISDGLWWAIVTMTSTGYGDYYPVTFAGRLMGVIIMLSGIIIVSTTVAPVASVYAHRRTLRDSNRLHQELEEIATQVEEINKKVEYLVKKK